MERGGQRRRAGPARLRVGLIAPPWLPVPPPDYGGTELVVDLLARGLHDAGCDVLLFTTGDSSCPVPRLWRHERALGTAGVPFGELDHVSDAYRALADVDVVHDHTQSGPALVDLHPAGTPIAATVHGLLAGPAEPLYATAAAAGVALVAISHSQRRSAPLVPIRAVIHHGIDVDACPAGEGDGGYLLFLGRMSAQKGPDCAIRIARAAGKRILLAAKMRDPDEHRFFRQRVEPLLGADAVYVGEVSRQRTLELLAGAEALLVPIRWREPFGLVMVEALACGTPVLAFREGAAPEIVEHLRTGFLCDDEDDMAARARQLRHLDRATCRASARARFSSARMVADHLDLYRSMLAGPPEPGMRLGEAGPMRPSLA